jgi:hypothetical protein
VGVYIDGFNLYYGGRAQQAAPGGTGGWKWLNIRSFSEALAVAQWANAAVVRVVYCTARISGATNPSGARDQEIYLRAVRTMLQADDTIEFGKYYEKTKTRPLATPDLRGRPVVKKAAVPVRVKDGRGRDVPDASFMVTVADREEKGSDVNVASHLLIDTLEGTIEAAIVVSNDSDLELPVREARKRIPVGVVNPGTSFTAGALTRSPGAGPGGHWERQLAMGDFTAHQMPDPCGGVRKPQGW